MLRRDLLIGSAATAAVSLSPLTLQAQKVETYHENIRRRAQEALDALHLNMKNRYDELAHILSLGTKETV